MATSAFRLLAEHAPPTRPLNVPGQRGTTFSATATHVLYNVADMCVLLPISLIVNLVFIIKS